MVKGVKRRGGEEEKRRLTDGGGSLSRGGCGLYQGRKSKRLAGVDKAERTIFRCENADLQSRKLRGF
ncbi:hypothetical protein HZH66_014249 [Vespula vulgaris]|uniref:Uncharacterized protein n=1 Tax=Vespula vulgaris TaxID=7454 RepID=A0A834J376_VESVU|nr:hypothetical protein HZH66_014249 [Vespula vulgaris]